jgi:antitoxin MazE
MSSGISPTEDGIIHHIKGSRNSGNMQLNFAVKYDMTDLIRSDAMKVFKWGNSLAVRLPKVIGEVFNLKAGDDVDVRVAVRTTLDAAQRADREEWLKRLRRFRGIMPADFKFDRDEANAR